MDYAQKKKKKLVKLSRFSQNHFRLFISYLKLTFIRKTIDSIPTDNFWLARKVHRSVNLCAHYVAY